MHGKQLRENHTCRGAETSEQLDTVLVAYHAKRIRPWVLHRIFRPYGQTMPARSQRRANGACQMNTKRILNLESFLRIEYGDHVSVGWCIFRRDHLVIFAGKQPLLTGTFNEIILELL